MQIKRLITTISIFAGVIIFPSIAWGAQCDFSRDLQLDDEGEDVRCLQKYLNGANFVISPTGVGSPGHETVQFKSLTKKALGAWQTQNGLPASGFFGPMSKQKYIELVGAITADNSSGLGSAAEAIKAKLASLTSQLAEEKAKIITTPAVPTTVTAGESEVKESIKIAVDKIYEARNQIDDERDNNVYAKDDLDKAEGNFLDGISFYLEKEYTQALKSLKKAGDYADDAFESAGGQLPEDKIDEYIEEVKDKIDSAWDKLEEAKDNGRSINESEDLLSKAEEMIEEAEDKFDEDKFDEAEKLAEDADDQRDEALDSVGETSKAEAKNAINSAENKIDQVQDEIDDANDDDDADQAQAKLKQANDKLSDARDEYSDGNYDQAKDLAEEAEDLADDAQDEL